MEDEKQIIDKLNEINNVSKEEKVTLASLKQKKGIADISLTDDALETRVKLRNFTSADSTVKSENIYIYFCSICGKKAIVANIGLDTLPNRRTDNSIAINMKQIFYQVFLKQDLVKFIKRGSNIEAQYRWKCEECGVFIAYQCFPYEEMPQNASNRPYLYVLNDALVINQQFSKLHQEVAKLKDQLQM